MGEAPVLVPTAHSGSSCGASGAGSTGLPASCEAAVPTSGSTTDSALSSSPPQEGTCAGGSNLLGSLPSNASTSAWQSAPRTGRPCVDPAPADLPHGASAGPDSGVSGSSNTSGSGNSNTSSGGSGDTSTQWGHVLCLGRGTPGFIAPEQYAGLDDLERVWVSQKADVYSFGVLLVSLFVGELQWPGVVLPGAPMERRRMLRQLALDGVAPTVPPGTEPPWLAPLVRVCTAHDPHARPSFSQVVAHLDAAEGAGQRRTPPRLSNGSEIGEVEQSSQGGLSPSRALP